MLLKAYSSDVVDRINTIDELLRNPNRFSIVGAIEGNPTPIMQTGARADAQTAFDKIKNTATLTSLIDMRKSTRNLVHRRSALTRPIRTRRS